MPRYDMDSSHIFDDWQFVDGWFICPMTTPFHLQRSNTKVRHSGWSTHFRISSQYTASHTSIKRWFLQSPVQLLRHFVTGHVTISLRNSQRDIHVHAVDKAPLNRGIFTWWWKMSEDTRMCGKLYQYMSISCEETVRTRSVQAERWKVTELETNASV